MAAPFTLNMWITHDFNNAEQKERRVDFMGRVYGISNGGDDEYHIFFDMFLDRVESYWESNNAHMVNTHEDFFELIRILKRAHRRPNRQPTFREIANAVVVAWTQTPDPTMVDCAIWLGMWTWLHITALETATGGIIRLNVQEGGQVVHPWNTYETIEGTTAAKLMRVTADQRHLDINRRSHEFSLRFNILELQTARISFLPTANLLEHLRVLRDYPEPFYMTVYIFHDKPILFAMLKGKNMIPRWCRELAQETLNTLQLLVPYDSPDSATYAAEFRGLFHIDFLQEMGNIALLGEDDDREIDEGVKTREYLTRSLQNYPYWGARLLELEKIVRGQKPSTFNQWSQEQRDARVADITWWAFLLSAVVLIATILATAFGGVATEEAKKANVFAGIASVAADSNAGLMTSLVDNLSCCCATASTGFQTMTDNTTTTVGGESVVSASVVTVTATTLVTVTVTTIQDITLTVTTVSRAT